MTRNILVFSLILISATLLDAVAGPLIVGPWLSLHFTAAAVALTGLKRGRWAGLLVGWIGGLLLASFSSAPLGLYMLSLGCTGFLAGYLQGLGSLRLPVLDAGLLLGFLFLEDAIAGFSAQAVLGVPWHPAFLGIFASGFLILMLLRRRIENLIT